MYLLFSALYTKWGKKDPDERQVRALRAEAAQEETTTASGAHVRLTRAAGDSV